MQSAARLLILRFAGFFLTAVLTATAADAGSLSLTATGGGSLSSSPGEGAVPDGTEVTITATPGPGTWLRAWGGSVPAHERWTGKTSLRITVTGTMAVSAIFGTSPPVRLFPVRGENFRAYRLSPDGKYALGAINAASGAGTPAFRERETRVITSVSSQPGRLIAMSEDHQTAIGNASDEAPSLEWNAQGGTKFFGRNSGSIGRPSLIYVRDLSGDGTVMGAARFDPQGQELVVVGSRTGGFPAMGVPYEYYGALSGNGRIFYSFLTSPNRLVTYDRAANTRSESAMSADWWFYPFASSLNFPAGTSRDGSVLVATFEKTPSPTTQIAALHKQGIWTPLPGTLPTNVFCISENARVATGSTSYQPTVWKLDGPAPLNVPLASWLTEEGAWLPPLIFNMVQDVNAEGDTVLVSEVATSDYDGSDTSWIAVRPVILQQTIAFTPPAATEENGDPVALEAMATSGQPVTFRLVSGPGRVEGSTYFPAAAGTAVLEANQIGGAGNYLAAPPATRSVTVSDAPGLAQISYRIQGNGSINGAAGDGFFPVNQPINLLAVPTPGGGHSFHSWQLEFHPVGQAVQMTSEMLPALLLNPANGQYVVTAKFATSQSITFDLPTGAREDTERIPVAAFSTSGLPVTITQISGPGSLSDGYYYPEAPGEVVFSARQPGNSNVAPAVEIQRSLTVIADTAPPSVILDHLAATTILDRPGVISGTVSDEASTILLELRNAAGEKIASRSLVSGQAFRFDNPPLVQGENRFTLRATGGRLVTNEMIVITWSPKHIFRLTGPLTGEEARVASLGVEAVSVGGLGGMTFEIEWPAQRFQTPVFLPSAALALYLVESNSSVPDKLRFTLATSGPPLPEGTTRLGTIRFRSRSFGTVPLETLFSLKVSQVSDDEGNPITAGLHAEGRSLTLQPRRHTGDINNNGRWDVGDAMLLQRLLAGIDAASPWDQTLNDLHASGGMDTGDVIKLLRAAALLDPNIPADPAPAPQPGPAPREVQNADGDAERLSMVVLNPEVLPGGILKIQIRTAHLTEPLPGCSFAVDFPADCLQPEGAVPVVPADNVPAGINQRTGTMEGAERGLNRLTFAMSGPRSFGESGGPLTLATLSFRVLPRAAGMVQIPLSLTAASLSSADGYEVRDPLRTDAVYKPQGLDYQLWSDRLFSPGQHGDPGIAGFTADPDGDGIANGLEFWLGGFPLDGNSPVAPEVTFGADGLPRFHYHRRPGIIGSAPTAEWTADPAKDWQSTGLVEESAVPWTDGTEKVTLRPTGGLEEFPRRWFRLRAAP